MDGARPARPRGRPGARLGRRPPDDGRRADLRLDRRLRIGRMEHRRGRSEQAPARRSADPPLEGTVRARRLPALRAGQMVSGRVPAALDVLALLAPRRQAGLVRPRADRRGRSRNRRDRKGGVCASRRDRLGARPGHRLHRAGLRGPGHMDRQGSQPARQCHAGEFQAEGSRGAAASRQGVRARIDRAVRVCAAGPALAGEIDGDPLAQREMEDAARRSLSRAGRQSGRLSPAARRAALCSAVGVPLCRRGGPDRAARAASRRCGAAPALSAHGVLRRRRIRRSRSGSSSASATSTARCAPP